MSALIATRRFSSPLFSADDVACEATRHRHAQEEIALEPTIVIPRRGVFQWQSGTSTVIAEPNTILLFDPEQPHRILHPTDAGDDCTALRFPTEYVHEALGERNERTHWILDARSQLVLHLALQTIRRTRDGLEAEEAAMTILRALAQSHRARPAANRAVDLVRERMAADPAERTTLSGLARGSGFSPYELARRFRAATGSSIHQYRLRLRLILALSRLQDGADDLTALALDLGFSSHAHFTSTFTRTFNVPPNSFRLRAGRERHEARA